MHFVKASLKIHRVFLSVTERRNFQNSKMQISVLKNFDFDL
jgi:hypothetical protein